MQENFKKQMGEILENHKKSFIIYISLVVFCCTYYIIWNRIGNIYQELLENNSAKTFNFEYKKIEKYGFPFYIKFQITEPKITVSKFNMSLDISSSVVFIENVFLSKKFNIYLDKITSKSDDKTQELFFDKDTNIEIQFSKYELTDLTIKSKEIKFINDLKLNNEILFKDILFTQNKLKNDNNDIMNIVLDSKQIIFNKIENDKAIKEVEFNVLFSISNNLNIYNDITLSINTILEKLIINNITNNYSFMADANYKKNMQTSIESGNANLKFTNFDNLLEANKKVDNLQIKTMFSILSILNKHPNDTEKEKFITVSKVEDSQDILINNENIKEAMMRILPLVQQLIPLD